MSIDDDASKKSCLGGSGVLGFGIQGVSKGAVVELVMAKFAEVDKKLPAFVLCIGDDRSDEDMFERITALVSEDEEEQKRVGSEERKREAEEEGKEEGGGEKKESERASPQHHVELFACTVRRACGCGVVRFSLSLWRAHNM